MFPVSIPSMTSIITQAKRHSNGVSIVGQWWPNFIIVLTFCGFPGYKPVPPGWFKICVGFYNGNTQRLTESGFMEKPGIEPATPGLQGIALIHYITAASCIIVLTRMIRCPAKDTDSV